MIDTSRLRRLASDHALPLGLFVAVSLVALAATLIPAPWTAWQPALCFPSCFCEAVRPGLVRQPANTYSNLAYILVGLLIAIPARAPALNATPTRNLLQSHRGFIWLYGGSVVAIGAGSLFYHASLTLTGQFFDWVGMYAFVSFVAVYTLFRLSPRRLPGWLFAGLYAALLAALCIDFFIDPQRRFSLFQNIVLVSIVLEMLGLVIRRPRIQFLFFIGGLACFVAARIIWGWDLDGTLCLPNSLFQGHAIWHLLTAATTALLYRYYSSETPRPV